MGETTWVKSPKSGLLYPFEVPELTMESAIDRGWKRRGRLMQPKPLEYIQTYPVLAPPGWFEFLSYTWPPTIETILQGIPVL